MKDKRLNGIMLAVIGFLLIPLIAMAFTDEVNWAPLDFAIAGGLLLGTGLSIDFVIRKVTKIEYRIAISLAILAVLLLIWTELAVGIFGTPFSGT